MLRYFPALLGRGTIVTGARCLLAGGLTLLAVAPARGQVGDPAAGAAFRRGPVAFTPSLSVPSIGVESNVFNETENPRSDFTTVFQPQMEAWFRFGRARIGAREQVNFVYYNKYTTQRAVNLNGTFRFDLLLQRGTAYAALTHVKTNDRPTVEIDERAEHRQMPITAGLDIRLTGKTNLDLATEYESVTFDDSATFQGAQLKSEFDRSTRGYRATLRHSLTPQTTVSLSAIKQEARFRFSPNRDSDSVRILPGLAFSPFALISGTMEVGVLRFNPEDPTVRPFRGIAARVDLSYVLLGATRFGLQITRDVTPSIDTADTYFLQTGATLSANHQISERWDAGVSGNRQHLGHRTNNIVVVPGAPVTDRNETVHTYSAQVGFRFSGGIRIGFRAESIGRESPLPNTSYDNLRLMSSINYGFR